VDGLKFFFLEEVFFLNVIFEDFFCMELTWWWNSKVVWILFCIFMDLFDMVFVSNRLRK